MLTGACFRSLGRRRTGIVGAGWFARLVSLHCVLSKNLVTASAPQCDGKPRGGIPIIAIYREKSQRCFKIREVVQVRNYHLAKTPTSRSEPLGCVHTHVYGTRVPRLEVIRCDDSELVITCNTRPWCHCQWQCAARSTWPRNWHWRAI